MNLVFLEVSFLVESVAGGVEDPLGVGYYPVQHGGDPGEDAGELRAPLPEAHHAHLWQVEGDYYTLTRVCLKAAVVSS